MRHVNHAIATAAAISLASVAPVSAQSSWEVALRGIGSTNVSSAQKLVGEPCSIEVAHPSAAVLRSPLSQSSALRGWDRDRSRWRLVNAPTDQEDLDVEIVGVQCAGGVPTFAFVRAKGALLLVEVPQLSPELTSASSGALFLRAPKDSIELAFFAPRPWRMRSGSTYRANYAAERAPGDSPGGNPYLSGENNATKPATKEAKYKGTLADSLVMMADWRFSSCKSALELSISTPLLSSSPELRQLAVKSCYDESDTFVHYRQARMRLTPRVRALTDSYFEYWRSAMDGVVDASGKELRDMARELSVRKSRVELSEPPRP
ncbi:MAG: hypothetical protein JWO05_1128 [Gemmatimonadetes bacterium]|nr:hypothetical protein [Gemmatimonadota bacterium]